MKTGHSIETKWVDPPFRICEFCKCNTNAKLRRCCDKGYKADLEKSKKKRLPWDDRGWNPNTDMTY